MPNQTCEWFVEPIGSHTNEWIMKLLYERHASTEVAQARADAHGSVHNVIDMPSYDEVRLVLASRADAHFTLNVFRRLPGQRHISLWTLYRFHKRPKVHLATA